MSDAPDWNRESLAAWVECGAVLLGLPIEEAWRPLVAEHLGRLLDAAALVVEFDASHDAAGRAPIAAP